MNVLHTLTDILGNLILLQIQQTGVCRFDFLNQLRQLTNAVIGLRLCKNGRNGMEDIQHIRVRSKVVTFLIHAVHLTPCLIIYTALRLEEELHTLHVLGAIQKVFLTLHHAGKQRNVVPALTQNIIHEVAGFCDNFLFRVTELRIGIIKKLLIMLLFLSKGVQHKTDQSVLVGRNVHRAKIVPEEGNAFAHKVFGRGNPAGNDGFVNLGFFSQIINQSALVLANQSTAVFDGDFLLRDQTSNQRSNINFAPAVGNRLIPALYIAH